MEDQTETFHGEPDAVLLLDPNPGDKDPVVTADSSPSGTELDGPLLPVGNSQSAGILLPSSPTTEGQRQGQGQGVESILARTDLEGASAASKKKKKRIRYRRNKRAQSAQIHVGGFELEPFEMPTATGQEGQGGGFEAEVEDQDQDQIDAEVDEIIQVESDKRDTFNNSISGWRRSSDWDHNQNRTTPDTDADTAAAASSSEAVCPGTIAEFREQCAEFFARSGGGAEVHENVHHPALISFEHVPVPGVSHHTVLPEVGYPEQLEPEEAAAAAAATADPEVKRSVNWKEEEEHKVQEDSEPETSSSPETDGEVLAPSQHQNEAKVEGREILGEESEAGAGVDTDIDMDMDFIPADDAPAPAAGPETDADTELQILKATTAKLHDALDRTPRGLVTSRFGWTENTEKIILSTPHAKQKHDETSRQYHLNEMKAFARMGNSQETRIEADATPRERGRGSGRPSSLTSDNLNMENPVEVEVKDKDVDVIEDFGEKVELEKVTEEQEQEESLEVEPTEEKVTLDEREEPDSPAEVVMPVATNANANVEEDKVKVDVDAVKGEDQPEEEDASTSTPTPTPMTPSDSAETLDEAIPSESQYFDEVNSNVNINVYRATTTTEPEMGHVKFLETHPATESDSEQTCCVKLRKGRSKAKKFPPPTNAHFNLNPTTPTTTPTIKQRSASLKHRISRAFSKTGTGTSSTSASPKPIN